MWYIIIYENKQKVRLLNMPIPKYDLPRYKLTENDRMDNVICQLHKMGYKFVAKTHRLAYGMKATFL